MINIDDLKQNKVRYKTREGMGDTKEHLIPVDELVDFIQHDFMFESLVRKIGKLL